MGEIMFTRAFTRVLAICGLFFSIFLFSCSSVLSMQDLVLGKYEREAEQGRLQKRESLVKLKSLREYLKKLGYENFASLSSNETIFVTYIPAYYRSNSFTYRLLDDIDAFCRAHNGELVSGKGETAIPFERVKDRQDIVLSYFNAGNTAYCTSREIPIKIKIFNGDRGLPSNFSTMVKELILVAYHPPEKFVGPNAAFKYLNNYKKESIFQLLKKLNKDGRSYYDLFESRMIGKGKLFTYQFVQRPISHIPYNCNYILRFRYGLGFWELVEKCIADGGILKKGNKNFIQWLIGSAGKEKLSSYPIKDSENKWLYPLKGTFTCEAPKYQFLINVTPYGYYIHPFTKEKGFLYRIIVSVHTRK